MTEIESILATMTPAERRLYRQLGGTLPHGPRPAEPQWHRVTGIEARKSRPEAMGTHPGRSGCVVRVDGCPPFASAADCARHFGLAPQRVRKAICLRGRVTKDGAYLPARVVRGMVARSRRADKAA